MPTRRALVVDDSKTARVTLGRVLTGFALEVDMADSAENALDYLKHNRPDVIFMDHMMPGMDGFEAVKVIKTDPRTATIPIMMYTTKSGEVYVGQARALGAVGVLPKEVKPADLQSVLQSLNLVGKPASPEPGQNGKTADAGTGPALTEAAEELQRYADDLVTGSQLRELLEDQHRRIGEEFDAKLEGSLARYADMRRAAERRYLYSGLVVLGLMLFLLPYWGVQLYTATTEDPTAGTATASQTAAVQSAVMEADDVSVQDLRDELQGLREQQNESAARMLDTVSWALNHSMEYEYGEVPLDGARLDTLQELLSRLNDLGIRGVVHLDVHTGNFCLQRDEFGNLVLAEQGIAVTDCDQVALTEEVIPTPEQSQSLAFANFLATSPLVQASAVDVQVNLIGQASPRVGYPDLASSSTAGAWNAAARSNNRVEIRLAPSPG